MASDAKSVFTSVTCTSLFSLLSGIASRANSFVHLYPAIGGVAVTEISAAGGSLLTLATSGARHATSIAGSVYTVAGS